MARHALTLIVAVASIALAACNTVRGAGQDLESAANSAENAMH